MTRAEHRERKARRRAALAKEARKHVDACDFHKLIGTAAKARRSGLRALARACRASALAEAAASKAYCRLDDLLEAAGEPKR